jgi:hypothetical protein
LNLFWVSCGLGVSLHLFLDQAFNGTRAFGYFLLYRLCTGFRKEYFFKPSS